MVTWGELREIEPDVCDGGKDLLYQFGVGLAFLATTRKDGAPRVHPICPVLTDDGLFAFLIPSPKCEDLLRDGRYALHSFPTPVNEDAFYVTGVAHGVADAGARDKIVQQFVTERAHLALSPSHLDDQTLFEFDIETCLHTKTTGHGDQSPKHFIWHASR